MFTKAIVRRPAKSLVQGITSNPQLGKPDYDKALRQHDAYIAALEKCGVAVKVLPSRPTRTPASWRTWPSAPASSPS